MFISATEIIFVLLAMYDEVAQSRASELQGTLHLTPGAARPPNELWCYRCAAADTADRCASLARNDSALTHKCSNDRRLCMVKRFSYTTSNENSTSTLKMWSLERNCTKNCQPGCIVIGERTKLYACTSCCNTTLCNVGSGAPRSTVTAFAKTVESVIVSMVLSFNFL